MKNEYIAGDLVKYLSQVVKIVEVYQDGTCYFGNETMCGQQDCKDAEPIPLTPEILEKNGWELYHGIYYSPNEEGVGVCLISQTGYVWNAYTEQRLLRSDINSVSDLQHLLFGLNINYEMEV